MNVIGLGNDILKTQRIRAIVQGKRSILERFATRVLHPTHERPRLNLDNTDQATQLLASTWAAKEAMYKSLSPDLQKQCVFREWYRTDNGVQRAIQSDRFPQEAFMVSVSHDGEYTSAVVLRLKNQD